MDTSARADAQLRLLMLLECIDVFKATGIRADDAPTATRSKPLLGFHLVYPTHLCVTLATDCLSVYSSNMLNDVPSHAQQLVRARTNPALHLPAFTAQLRVQV